MEKEDISKLANEIVSNTLYCTKAVLTSDEAARYMGITKSYLYKLTMRNEIPYYKPLGKQLYFDRAELEEWLRSNRAASSVELSQRAQAYCSKGGL